MMRYSMSILARSNGGMRFVLLSVLVVICMTLSTRPARALEYSAKFNLSAARELTLGPDGRVWFFARSGQASRSSLYAAASTGAIAKIRLPGGRVKSAHDRAIGIGGDKRLWVSLSGVPRKGRTTIYRIDRHRRVSIVRVLKGHDALSFAADAKRRTWFLGYSSRRVGYFDSRRRLHTVSVPKANSLESVVRGPDGAMWASSRAGITVFSRSGRMAWIETNAPPTPGIAVGGGSVWMSDIGGIQRISASRIVEHIDLKYPNFSAVSSSHTSYPYNPYRMTYSVFGRPDAAIGFTSGTQVSEVLGQHSFQTSLGSVSTDGTVTEMDPASAGVPSWLDNSNLRDRLWPVRRREAKLALVDRKDHLWAATDDGIAVFPLPK